MPACLIDQEHSMCAGLYGLGDLDEMQVHRLGIAGGQDQSCTLALFRADGTEDVGRGGSLITGRTGTRAALRPAASNDDQWPQPTLGGRHHLCRNRDWLCVL